VLLQCIHVSGTSQAVTCRVLMTMTMTIYVNSEQKATTLKPDKMHLLSF